MKGLSLRKRSFKGSSALGVRPQRLALVWSSLSLNHPLNHRRVHLNILRPQTHKVPSVLAFRLYWSKGIALDGPLALVEVAIIRIAFEGPQSAQIASYVMRLLGFPG